MKLCRVACGCLCALSGMCFADLNGAPCPPEVLRIADLHVPKSPFAFIEDPQKVLPSGFFSEAFVFSAQNPRDGKFDLHCKYMSMEKVFRRHTDISDFADDVIVTGCVRAVISQTRCYRNGLILDCAREQTEEGQYCHCEMYLLKQEGTKMNPLPFARKANDAGMFPCQVEESLFCAREAGTNCLAKVWVLTKDAKSSGATPLWSIVEAKVDLNSFTNYSERVIMSYEDSEPRGLTMF